MSQTRLNYLMILHVHKERTDALKDKLVEVANMFVDPDGSEHRRRIFGPFTSQDLAKAPVLCKHKVTQTIKIKIALTTVMELYKRVLSTIRNMLVLYSY